MSTFESSRSLFNQQHFTIIEIDLPVVEGVCTIGGSDGYGTPLSCDEATTGTKTYKFTDGNAPILPESGILRLVASVSETPTKLQSGKGLSSRGTAQVSFTDITGIDPNPDAPAVTQEVIDQGSYFGKLDARNIIANRDVRIKNYRVESDGSIDLDNGAETRHYLAESLTSSRAGIWSLKLKDELSKVNDGESVWPLPLEGSLRLDIDNSVTSIPVDANITYLIGDTIRVGDEFMKVSNVSGIGTGSATLTVGTRGNPIVYTNTLTTTEADSHSATDEVYVCEVSDDENIADLIKRILIDVGVDSARIPIADWLLEIAEWHPTNKVNTLWLESDSTSSVLESILTFFMLDLWFEPVSREMKLSAISVWKESASTLIEGSQIDFDTIKRKKEENLRSTRALVVYDKRNLATSSSVENYKKLSIFKRTDLEASDLFGEPKTHRFEFSQLLSKNAADLLVQRYVSRFINPASYKWTTQERKLDFSVGDVVDIQTGATVGFNGLPSSSTRGQITAIKPVYSAFGRVYSVDALAYEPIFADGDEIVITGNISDINLYNQFAGAPSSAVTLTFVFDNVTSSSTDSATPSIKLGAFASGSAITLIMVNGADLQAKGGNGGRGQELEWSFEEDDWIVTPPANGVDGAIVIDCQGVDVDIYFSGSTGNANYPLADGYIRAPSGGDGGKDGSYATAIRIGAHGGDGGNGGNGLNVGIAGSGGVNTAGADGLTGINGVNNLGWGVDGLNNNAIAGISGSGIIDGGGVVNLFGATITRYINGNGDH